MLLNFLIWTHSDGWATAWLFGMVAIGRFMLLKGSKFRKEERKEGRGKGKHRRKKGEENQGTWIAPVTNHAWAN